MCPITMICGTRRLRRLRGGG
uniref:Uncharacterized protein n=1 Tax=Arundo donax TaxID=35708 RepID=A0A0A8ZER1_ARUDO